VDDGYKTMTSKTTRIKKYLWHDRCARVSTNMTFVLKKIRLDGKTWIRHISGPEMRNMLRGRK